MPVRVSISRDADQLIQRYDLSPIISQIKDAVTRQPCSPLSVVSITMTADHEWSPDKPRVLMTVRFDGDLVQAYDAWKQIRPFVSPVSRGSEEAETLTFAFAGYEE